MSDLVERRDDSTASAATDSETAANTDLHPDSDSAVAEIRERVERVRRRELDDALGRLEARGEVTPEQRRIVAALSAGVAGALVERWTVALDDEATDPEAVRDLLVESSARRVD